MPDDHDIATLLEPLIEGLTEQPPWGRFLDDLRARLRSDYASITFRPFERGTPPPEPDAEDGPPSPVIHLSSGRQSPPIVARLYRESLHRDDPLPYHQLADGRVYALPELLRVGDERHEAYRAQLLAPSGMNLLRMMRVEEPSGVSAWLTFSRETEDFSTGEERLAATLAPHLWAALGAFVALERERTAARVAGEMIARMNFTWMTLDSEGCVLAADPQGGEVLARTGLLRRGRDGRLEASSLEVERRITTAIRTLAGKPQGRPCAIVLSREPWFDMLLVSASPAVARRGAGQVGPVLGAPSLIAYVHADRWSSADRCDQLSQLFDLAPGEARIALALSRGMSIAEAAAELGLSVESARTYSKRIYAKTGARGQADLVRFIHRSVLAIA
jgi:DNA-binding CsgD family transcriptional regulator